CGWPMPLVMVVAECKNFQDSRIAHQRLEYVNPIVQIASAVDDGLVPGRGLLLNPFTVSEPSNISEVRRNQVKLFLHLPRPRHKRCIGQCQSNVMLPEHVRESGIEPGLVSNLDCKFVVGRKFLQEGCQHGEKMTLLGEFPTV